ncbi:unnamed protein product, partial [marine sediment metagenome]
STVFYQFPTTPIAGDRYSQLSHATYRRIWADI